MIRITGRPPNKLANVKPATSETLSEIFTIIARTYKAPTTIPIHPYLVRQIEQATPPLE